MKINKLFLLVLLLGYTNINYSQYEVDWHNINNFTLNTSVNELTKTSYTGWNTSALSTNKLNSSTDGYFTYVVTGEEKYTAIGFNEYNYSLEHAGVHRIYINNFGNNHSVLCYDVNTLVGSDYNLDVGDEIKLERSGSQMIYSITKVNSTTVILATRSTDATKELYVDIASLYSGSVISNMYCSFEEGLTIDQNVLHHQNFTDNSLGSIDVNVTGAAPLSYSWSNGATTQDVLSLTAGSYTLTVTDGNSETLSKTFEIESETFYQVNWHNLNNFVLDPITNILDKSSSTGWNAYAISTNKLPANTNGKYKYTITGNEDRTMLGLEEYNNSNSAGINRISIVNNGASNYILCYKGNAVVGADYVIAVGDEIILERKESEIIYRINKVNGIQNVIARVSTDPTKELYVNVTSFDGSSYLDNMYCSFEEGLTIEQNVLHHQNFTDNSLGSIDVNVTGVAPLSYSWSNGATTQDVSSLTAGSYTLTVTDGNSETLSKTFEIESETFYQVSWHNLNNFVLDPITNILDKSSYTGWNAYAISTNKLPANTNGKYKYTITGNEDRTILGLGEYNNSNSAGTNRIFISNLGSANAIVCYNGNSVTGADYNTAVGDEIILERKESEIIYRINKVNGIQNVIATVSIDPTKELYVNVTSYDVNSELDNMYCSFEEGLTIDQNVLHHQNFTDNSLGSIDVNVTGAAPLSYSWSNGATTQDVSSLTAGSYTLTVTDGNSETLSKTFEIESETFYQVNWHNLNNFVLDPITNILDKSSYTGWNAYAISTNKLPANTNGKYKYTITGNEDRTILGLGEYNNSNSAGTNRIFISNLGSANAIVCYNGNSVTGADYNTAVGDEIILERKESEIIYRINKVNGIQNVIATVSIDPTKELYVNVTSYDVNSELDNMYCSFEEGLTIDQNVLHHQNFTDNSLGSIDVNVTGAAPLSYSWSNGATTQDVSSLTAGSYTLTVTDGNSETLSKTFEIESETFYQVNWQDINNYVLDPITNVLDKTSSIGWNAYAISTNKLPANTNGKYKYTITGNEDRTILGLGEYNNSNSAGTNRIFISNLGSANAIVCYNGNSVTGADYNTAVGDEIILERKESEIIYRINKVNGIQNVIATVSTDPTKELYVNVVSFDASSYLDNMYCTFGIDNEKCSPSITLSSTQNCPGDYVELTVNTNPNNEYDDYSFVWSPSNSVSSTATPLTYVVNPTGQTDYTLQYTFYSKSKEVICSGEITTTVNMGGENCEELNEVEDDVEVLGCCFGNFGAGVYVGGQTNLNVYCNLLNELGNNDNAVVQGKFLNKGGINVELDWIHNAQNELYVSSEGNTTLIGENQQLRGNSETYFYNLKLDGNSTTKEILIDEHVRNVLQLNDNELATIDDVLYVENIDENSILRSNGYVSTNGTGGLNRALANNSQAYLFPMGSQQLNYRYRPVIVKNAGQELFQVNFQNSTVPVGISTLIKAPNVQSLNTDYYYKLNSNSNTADVELFYPASEGPYQSLSQWRTPQNPQLLDRWEMSSGPGASNTLSSNSNTLGLLSASSIGVQDYMSENFTLSRAGFYVNTGSLNGGNDGSLIVTVTNSLDNDGNGINDVNGTNPSGVDSDGDGIDDSFDVDNTGGVDVDGDGIDDNYDANTTGSSSTDGGLNTPNTPGQEDEVFAPSPVAGTYNINIASNDDCIEEGIVQFTVDNNGQIDEAVKYIPEGSTQIEFLSEDVFETDDDNTGAGLILNATPENFLLSCVNEIKIKMGVNEPFILSLPGGSESIIIESPLSPSLLDGAIFKVYNSSNVHVRTYSNQLSSSQNTLSTASEPWFIEGAYSFELILTNGVSETIKGQFIIK